MSMPSENLINNLIQTIQESRSENDDQRFGQLIFNMLACYDGRNDTYDENFHVRLFYIENEELIKILKDYQKNGLKHS